MILLLTLILLIHMGVVTLASERERSLIDGAPAQAQTTVVRDENSPTGYYVTFRYKDQDATRVKIRGEWSFSDARHSSIQTSANIMPEGYENGMFPLQIESGDEWLIVDMTLNAITGIWEYTIPLPCGVWSYRFIVDRGDEMYVTSDPYNRPVERSVGQQTNSQVYVPFDPQRQVGDWSIQFPRSDGRSGTLEIAYYDASNLDYALLDEPTYAVYLPYGYDPSRIEPYKVLYALHGLGVESETSWWNKGAVGNMTDNLIADYGMEPYVVIMPNNYADSFDYTNLLRNIIPAVEVNYNVRTDSAGKAICGISVGAICAKNVLLHSPEEFGYYGFFSGCYYSDSTETFDGLRMEDCAIYLGAGEREGGLTALYRTTEKLANAGKKDFQVFTVMGGHNWYTWRQIYVDFVRNGLWNLPD